MKRIRTQRGTALLETAITIPIILLISVGIFEFGRAYQTWQVLTNAAREGARVAVLPDSTPATIEGTVRAYLTAGKLTGVDAATVTIVQDVPFNSVTASRVTVNYPFSFIVLNPVAELVTNGANPGAPLTMQASALMRNE